MKEKSFRLALVVTRDLSPDTAWGRLLELLRVQGHEVVASKQQIPVSGFGTSDATLEIFPPDIMSGSYLTIALEPSAPETLGRMLGRSDYASTHAVLLTMLSRRDSSGSFRTLDREVVIRQLLLSLISQLVRARPSHLIFEETPHEATDFALYQIAHFMGIPCLFFQPSLVGPQLVARTAIDRLLRISPHGGAGLRPDLELARVAAINISRAAVRKLQDGGGTELLDRQKRIDSVTGGLASKLRAFSWTGRSLLTGQPNELVNLTGHKSIPRRVRKAHEVFASWSLRKSLHQTISMLPSSAPQTNGRYAVFALHYEPERTNMPEGLPYLSQLDAVLAARRFLPPNVSLIVKEHYAQQSSSLRGYVGRSPLAYNYLRRIPGVELVGVKANTRELVKGAVGVFTMTGKIGIEAAFLGKPAIYLGQPWWGGMPGAMSFSDLETFEDVSKSPSPTAHQVWSWFDEQIGDQLLFGLGGTSPQKYSARISPLPHDFEQLEFESLANAVRAFFSENP